MSAEKAVEEITMHGFEVEEVEHVGLEMPGLVVGEILEIEKHPNADKLQVVRVDVGPSLPASLPNGERGKGNILQIVCGAHNISVGDKVPVATVGTKLPGDFEIKEAEIRGVKSFGMLCAEDELGLGKDHSGILLLDKSAKVGTPAGELLGEKDTILDIKVLPDRAHDAVSHVGMAREIAALGGTETDYDYDNLILPKKKAKNLGVKIEKAELCERYIAVAMKNIQVTSSPQWLKNRLENCGIRSINNVVDVTNYVMLELGQPLHAFDLAKVSGMQFPISNDQFPNKSQISNSKKQTEIIVRNAKKGEKITILDGSVKELSSEDIVIANEKEALALAGVMGGSVSGVSDSTTQIILEAATFHPTSIRRTRTRHNLPTDAALRFEKGLDPNLAEKAAVRAIELLEHIAGAQVRGIVDEYTKKKKPWTIKLDLSYTNKLLGENIPEKTSKQILEALGFGVKASKKEFIVNVPTFRLDALTQEDLIEEIGRIYGYDKIKAIAPHARVQAAPVNEKRMFARKLKGVMATQGFSEVYNYSFYGQKEANLIGMGSVKHLELETPLSPELALVRVSLVPNMLKNVKENLKNFKDIKIFELGREFWIDQDLLPEEKMMLVGAIVADQKGKKGQINKREESPFFAAKAAVDDLMAQLGITDHYYDTFNGSPLDTPRSVWHESRSAEIKIEGIEKAVGYLGEINPFMLANVDIHTRVAMFELDMEALRSISSEQSEFEPLRKFPVVSRDIAMVVDGQVRVDDILKIMQSAGGNLVLDVDLFDIYDFADGTSSYAFHILIGADDRTLTSGEIDGVMEKITQELEKKEDLQIRK